MSGFVLLGGRVASATGLLSPGWLATEGKAIADVGQGDPPPEVLEGRDVVDVRDRLILPGFIDVHLHGALGHETMDADPAALEAIAGFAARHGITSMLATTWTASADATMAALKAVTQVVDEPLQGARILGAHMEGPYLNPRRCGAQDEHSITRVDETDPTQFLDTGVVRLITIAPEVPGNLWLVGECARRGITPSVGHTDATYEEALQAVEAGARHVTHAFNAMRQLHHREPGAIGAALSSPQLACEVIADNIHMHPAVMRTLLAAKGVDGVLLITDAIRPTGQPDGDYRIDDRTVTVRDGAVRLETGTLAGSVLTMDRAFANLAAATGLPAEAIWPAASRTAARSVGVGDRKGSIAPGMDADVVVLDDHLTVRSTIVEGRVAHRTADDADAGAPPAPTRARRETP